MAIPSSTPIVLNSKGMAPASRRASFTRAPNFWRWAWPGTISTWEFTTATKGLPMSASVTPTALSRLRWGALSIPTLMASDRMSHSRASPALQEKDPKNKNPRGFLPRGSLSISLGSRLDHRTPGANGVKDEKYEERYPYRVLVGGAVWRRRDHGREMGR